MRPVDYDTIAAEYDRRYETNRFDELEECVRDFATSSVGNRIAEIGCGTGHWLRLLADLHPPGAIAGLDLSTEMLATARRTVPSAMLVRGAAEHLPWADASFDCILCVNALHHFPHRQSVFAECARILRPGGTFLTIGLDPHTGTDTWWIYDYFPGALIADRARYPAAAAIRAALSAAGFGKATTRVAQHLPATMKFDTAVAHGLLNRSSTSQLMVISDEEFADGEARLLATRPTLHADLRLYATIAQRDATLAPRSGA